jgi:hypothetical protein
MPNNPFTDVWHFLTATTNDYLHQGNWRYLILALFWELLLVSIESRHPELAGGPDATYRPTFWNLAGPGPDRRHVVPRHIVETAAAGVRWLAILDRTGIDQRGVRVSPHFLEGYRVASHERVWTDCFFSPSSSSLGR